MRPMDQNYENCVKSVQAMVVLHNYLRRKEVEASGIIVQDEDETIKSGLSSLSSERRFNASGSKKAKEMREKLADYFFSPAGRVDFQWERTFGK